VHLFYKGGQKKGEMGVRGGHIKRYAEWDKKFELLLGYQQTTFEFFACDSLFSGSG